MTNSAQPRQTVRYQLETPSDVENLLLASTEAETEAKFEQGDILLVAIERGIIPRGARTEQLAGYALAIGRHPRTLYRRLVASRVFPPELRRPDVPWETHARLGELVEWAQKENVEGYDPHYWLRVAAGELDGQRKSADKIVAMIRQRFANAATGGITYATRAESVTVVATNGNDLLIRFPDGLPATLAPGMSVTVTISYTDPSEVTNVSSKESSTVRAA